MLRSSGRFGGIIDLFHVLQWTSNGVVGVSSGISKVLEKGKISLHNILPNSNKYVILRDALIKNVTNWLK